MLRTLIKPAYLSVRELVLHAFVRPGLPANVPRPVRSLLVIADRRLGDLCLAIPSLQCLREAYPEATFGLVVNPRLQPLAQWACRPNQTFDYEDKRGIVRHEWDIVIDLNTDYHLKPAQLAASTRSSVRIGFDVKGRGRYFNLPLPMSETEHMQRTYARILDPLGIPFTPFPLPAVLPAGPVAEWSKHAVAIHPGAHYETQRWPEEYFAQLIRHISGGGERCVVLASEQERVLAERIVRLAGDGVDLGIVKDVLELAATIRASEVLVCNNSGPLHLASLLGVPTLSFMGPTVKERWAPLGKHAVTLRRDALACIGCNSGSCKIRTLACMKEITPDAAYGSYVRLRTERLLAELM